MNSVPALDELWPRRADIEQANRPVWRFFKPMSRETTILRFPRLMVEIVACWSEGRCAVRGVELRRRADAGGTPLDDAEWEGMLTVLSLPYIDGSINFLLFSWDADVYVINYASVARFLESEAGWAPALQSLLGIKVPALRRPARGRESDWAAWLDAMARQCRPACFARYAQGRSR